MNVVRKNWICHCVSDKLHSGFIPSVNNCCWMTLISDDSHMTQTIFGLRRNLCVTLVYLLTKFSEIWAYNHIHYVNVLMSKWLDITIHDVNVPYAVGMFAAVSSLPRFSCVVTAAKIYDTAATSSQNSRQQVLMLVRFSLSASPPTSQCRRPHVIHGRRQATRSKVNRLSTWASM